MTPAARVARSLAEVAAAIEPRGHEHWVFTPAHDTTIAMQARIDDGWLLLTAPPHHMSTTRDPWATLAANGLLPGGARFALAARALGLHRRADVPLDPEVDVGGRILAACAGLARVGDGDPQPLGAAADTAVEITPELARRCGATNWPVTARGAPELVVDLAVPGAFHQAVVRAGGDGTVATMVPLFESGTGSRLTDVGRRAIARLLLRLGGSVRHVRAAVAPDDPASLRLEVVQTDPTTVELTHTFAALATACRFVAAETLVLAHDEAVARLYLQQSHEAAVPQAA